VQPKGKRDPGQHTQAERQHGRPHAPRRVHALLRAVTTARDDEQNHRPDQKRAKQQQVGHRVVGQQMGQRPGLDAQHHGVVQPSLDQVAGHVSGRQQNKTDQRQQSGDMAQGHRCGPQHLRLKPGLAPAPEQQHKAKQRGQAVQPLPGHRSDALYDGRTPAVGKDAA
jgi:hypothetical protein